ncbi:division/outer membrane stress-associated lipid-binding lipoprotein [Motilimonas pumila]|uniref:Osmotically-inducible protein OsmY n=1 Tax=Motilimonas pumila TaxID=2303987 RepID=A0A418YI27_9GAMM|nr:division/outer membrane stress-associated lipid-binding lipoprotein [Motilimonas pumila]RJG50023.1 osmotically-inducible protein OsmY [Motilimonas pumila]
MTVSPLLRVGLLASILGVQGCAGLVVAGAATTAVMVSDNRSIGAQIDDQNIEIKAANALAKNEGLMKASRISAISNNGHVLLVGQTSNEEYRQQAETTVRSVAGVTKVYNEIRVAGLISLSQRSSDSWLTTKTKSLLLDDPKVNPLKIKVVTENSEVFLIGLVTQDEAAQAVEITRNINGVKRVVKVFQYLETPAQAAEAESATVVAGEEETTQQ